MSLADSPDAYYMMQAISLAERTWESSYPALNAGVLIVDQGAIIGQASASGGSNTAPILQAIGSINAPPSPAAKLYSTLEPELSQVGQIRIALERRGIRKLVIATAHPHKAHAGLALKNLQQAGFEIQTEIQALACQDLNFLWYHRGSQTRPFVAAKVALTLDGKFAAASGQSKWVTGPSAREDVHQWRRRFPAIVVGASTVIKDDPQLTARVGALAPYCPTRCVLDTHLSTLKSKPLPQLYRDRFKERTILICCESSAEANRSQLLKLGLNFWAIPSMPNGRLCLKSFLEHCQQASIHGLYFEPGPQLLSSLLEAQLLDYLFAYKAPKLINDQSASGIGSPRHTQSMEAAYTLRNPLYTQFGQDYLVRGHLK